MLRLQVMRWAVRLQPKCQTSDVSPGTLLFAGWRGAKGGALGAGGNGKAAKKSCGRSRSFTASQCARCFVHSVVYCNKIFKKSS
jgi:hypothetical protein